MSITRINNNVGAISATRNLNSIGRRLSKNIERLSSGLRINRAGDDAAGLTIRERLRTQIRGTNMAIRNAQDGISMANTTEGALDSIVSSLQRIRELAIQAGNTGTNDIPAIQAIQDEVFQQVDEVNRIANTARFSSRVLFTGDNANITDVLPGQDELGISISNDPNASNLKGGGSILNIIKTVEGTENLLPAHKEDGQAIYATGIKDATDIAVTVGRFDDGAGTGLVAADVLTGTFFGGVSIATNDIITFQGVLSDGVTPFAGSISVAAGTTMTNLAAQVQLAIDNSETALFGGNPLVIPESFVQTHVDIPTAGATVTDGNGRMRFLSAKEAGTSTTTLLGSTTDAPTKFEISFNLLNQTEDLKLTTETTRDWVEGLRVGGQYGNHMQGITGSTFDTGNFSIEVNDIIPPNRRRMETDLVFTDSAGSVLSRTYSLARGAVLNGTFVESNFTASESGIVFEADDTLSMQGTNADGSVFETVFTLSSLAADDTTLGDGLFATLSGLMAEMNYRNVANGLNGPTEQSAFKDAKLTLSGNGKLQLIDDIADHSQSSLFMIVDDVNTTRTLTDRSEMLTNGNPEEATISINGGERQRVRIGDEVTLFGEKPTKFGENTPSLTMRIGAGFRTTMSDSITNKGIDTAEIEAQEYEGTLNGGSTVIFQNGDTDVFFESGTSGGVAQTLMLDFDKIIDITGPPTDGSTNTGMAILLSTINNALNFQIGPYQGQDMQINIPDMRHDRLGFGFGSGMTVADIDVTTVEGYNQALTIIDRALDQVSRTRSALGAFTNRMDTTVSSLSINEENLQASESRLSDVDIASETSSFTSNQILFQAGTSVLSQANFLPQGLLSLLG